MTNNELEAKMAAAVDETLKASVHVVPARETSLADHMLTIERAREQLREKLRRDRLSILAERGRRWTELHTEHAARMSEFQAKLDRELEVDLRQLDTETQRRLRDNDDLMERM